MKKEQTVHKWVKESFYKDRIENVRSIDLQREDLYFEVADLFTQVRLQLGLTEKKLAKKLNTKQPSIARWESGKSTPTIKTLEKLAEVANKRLEIKLK